MPMPLAVATFWMAVVCCAVAQWFILRGTLTASATLFARNAAPASRRTAEVAWAVLPAVLLAVVLAATWRAMQPHSSAAVRPAPEHTAARVREPFRA